MKGGKRGKEREGCKRRKGKGDPMQYFSALKIRFTLFNCTKLAIPAGVLLWDYPGK